MASNSSNPLAFSEEVLSSGGLEGSVTYEGLEPHSLSSTLEKRLENAIKSVDRKMADVDKLLAERLGAQNRKSKKYTDEKATEAYNNSLRYVSNITTTMIHNLNVVRSNEREAAAVGIINHVEERLSATLRVGTEYTDEKVRILRDDNSKISELLRSMIDSEEAQRKRIDGLELRLKTAEDTLGRTSSVAVTAYANIMSMASAAVRPFGNEARNAECQRKLQRSEDIHEQQI